MASSVHSGAVWQQIRRLFALGTVSGLTEGELLARFADRRDEVAFAALVARHGAMVLGVCRRMLNDPEDIEDAFQATFLVLVRRAKSVRPNEAVGHWLYGVAHRVALRARSEAAQRRSRERPVAKFEDEARVLEGGEPHCDAELRRVLDEEIARLPETYRAAIVLCYLEGRTNEDAARQLGWPVGTVKGRLARARELLRGRLTRRGLAPTSGALLTLLAQDAEASVPSSWIDTTVEAAMRHVAGETTAGVISASAIAFAEGVLRTMIVNQLKIAGAALAVITAVAAGAGVYAQQAGRNVPSAARTSAEIARAEAPNPASISEGAVTGTTSPTQTKASAGPETPSARPEDSAASRAFEFVFEGYRAATVDLETVYQWSRRLEAHDEASPDAGQRARAAEGHRKRMEQLDRMAKAKSNINISPGSNLLDAGKLNWLTARYYLEEAERSTKPAEAGKDPAVVISTPSGTLTADAISLGIAPPRSPVGPASSAVEPGKDARSLSIIAKLDELVAVNFATETPLEEFLNYIKTVTKSPEFPNGLPIYVDPVGLQEAEATMTSPVTIDLEGVPLRRTLHLALKQLGLVYLIEDGMIFITGEGSENHTLPAPMYSGSTPLQRLQEKAERGEMTPAERKAFIEMLKDLKEIETLLHGPGNAKARQ